MITITETLYKKMPDDIKACFNQLPNPSSEEVRECFPDTKSGLMKQHIDGGKYNVYGKMYPRDVETIGDSGNASRFFKSIKCEYKSLIYKAKASKSERTAQGTITNGHPTIKPIALMEYLIKMVTKPGGTVLDPFAGSGSTGIACKKLNRNFIGIERDEEYCKIAEARINNLTLK